MHVSAENCGSFQRPPPPHYGWRAGHRPMAQLHNTFQQRPGGEIDFQVPDMARYQTGQSQFLSRTDMSRSTVRKRPQFYTHVSGSWWSQPPQPRQMQALEQATYLPQHSWHNSEKHVPPQLSSSSHMQHSSPQFQQPTSRVGAQYSQRGFNQDFHRQQTVLSDRNRTAPQHMQAVALRRSTSCFQGNEGRQFTGKPTQYSAVRPVSAQVPTADFDRGHRSVAPGRHKAWEQPTLNRECGRIQLNSVCLPAVSRQHIGLKESAVNNRHLPVSFSGGFYSAGVHDNGYSAGRFSSSCVDSNLPQDQLSPAGGPSNVQRIPEIFGSESAQTNTNISHHSNERLTFSADTGTLRTYGSGASLQNMTQSNRVSGLRQVVNETITSHSAEAVSRCSETRPREFQHRPSYTVATHLQQERHGGDGKCTDTHAELYTPVTSNHTPSRLQETQDLPNTLEWLADSLGVHVKGNACKMVVDEFDDRKRRCIEVENSEGDGDRVLSSKVARRAEHREIISTTPAKNIVNAERRKSPILCGPLDNHVDRNREESVREKGTKVRTDVEAPASADRSKQNVSRPIGSSQSETQNPVCYCPSRSGLCDLHSATGLPEYMAMTDDGEQKEYRDEVALGDLIERDVDVMKYSSHNGQHRSASAITLKIETDTESVVSSEGSKNLVCSNASVKQNSLSDCDCQDSTHLCADKKVVGGLVHQKTKTDVQHVQIEVAAGISTNVQEQSCDDSRAYHTCFSCEKSFANSDLLDEHLLGHMQFQMDDCQTREGEEDVFSQYRDHLGREQLTELRETRKDAYERHHIVSEKVSKTVSNMLVPGEKEKGTDNNFENSVAEEACPTASICDENTDEGFESKTPVSLQEHTLTEHCQPKSSCHMERETNSLTDKKFLITQPQMETFGELIQRIVTRQLQADGPEKHAGDCLCLDLKETKWRDFSSAQNCTCSDGSSIESTSKKKVAAFPIPSVDTTCFNLQKPTSQDNSDCGQCNVKSKCTKCIQKMKVSETSCDALRGKHMNIETDNSCGRESKCASNFTCSRKPSVEVTSKYDGQAEEKKGLGPNTDDPCGYHRQCVTEEIRAADLEESCSPTSLQLCTLISNTATSDDSGAKGAQVNRMSSAKGASRSVKKHTVTRDCIVKMVPPVHRRLVFLRRKRNCQNHKRLRKLKEDINIQRQASHVLLTRQISTALHTKLVQNHLLWPRTLHAHRLLHAHHQATAHPTQNPIAPNHFTVGKAELMLWILVFHVRNGSIQANSDLYKMKRGEITHMKTSLALPTTPVPTAMFPSQGKNQHPSPRNPLHQGTHPQKTLSVKQSKKRTAAKRCVVKSIAWIL